MLDSTLLRVSKSYRDGYRDGEACNELSAKTYDPFDGPFKSYDYQQGYRAGLNDAFWKAFHVKYGTQGTEYLEWQKATDEEKRNFLKENQ